MLKLWECVRETKKKGGSFRDSRPCSMVGSIVSALTVRLKQTLQASGDFYE